MTITHVSHLRREAHEHLSWLTGALARALMARAHLHAQAVEVLKKLAACDFSEQALAPQSSRMTNLVMKHLPEAAMAALDVAREVAMAVAAANEHLDWRQMLPEVAVAEVVGEEGVLRCCRGRLRLLLAAPGAVLDGKMCAGGIFLPLAGSGELVAPVRAPVWQEEIAAGVPLSLPDDMRLTVGKTPLLAALFGERADF